jgi:ketosteroid isomerase-like protein
VAADSTLTPAPDIPGLNDVYVGLEEFVAFNRSWAEDWKGLRMRLVETVDVGDDRVLAIVHQAATGKASGAAVELDFGIVYTFEDGKVVDRKDYWVEDARRVAGLSS